MTEEDPEKSLSLSYTLEIEDPTATDGVSNCTIYAPNDDVAKMRAAGHLQISYPLEREPFTEKNGLLLRQEERVLFP